LDADDSFGAGEAPREVGHIPLQQSHFRHERIGLRGFWAALDRRQCAKGAGVALALVWTLTR